MAAVDAAAPEPVEVLIDRAGAAVAHEALRLLGGGYGRRVVVLAGKGNNGADGRAAAGRLRRRGVRVVIIDAESAPTHVGKADLVVDAAYGTGFRGEHQAPDAAGAPVLAVDIPSGVDGRTGLEHGRAWAAECTVTFAALKPGLLLPPGRSLSGRIRLADIGLDVTRASAGVVEASDVARWVPDRAPTAHKWNAALLLVAGSPGMTGAAHLAAASAQRAGAGMVRLGSPGLDDDPGRPTEAVGLTLPADGWASVVVRASERFGAAVMGPGLGRGDAVRTGVREVAQAIELPLVIDGDGLWALGGDVGELVGGRVAPTVLTPHDGEHQHLTGEVPPPDRFAAARRLANTTGAVVLLKGPTTVVADPIGRLAVVLGSARLATAGTGDVLSGVIGALLARGVGAFEAAAAGAWLHARAATLAEPVGLVAGDLPQLVGRALAEVRD